MSAKLIKGLTINLNEVTFLIEIDPDREKDYREVQSLAEVAIKNLKDNYLSNYKMGGGAMSEHSHGINLWQTFCNFLNMGKVSYVSSSLIFASKSSIIFWYFISISRILFSYCI